MRTEAQEYETHLGSLIGQVEEKIAKLERKTKLTAADDIELTALEVLLQRLDELEGY